MMRYFVNANFSVIIYTEKVIKPNIAVAILMSSIYNDTVGITSSLICFDFFTLLQVLVDCLTRVLDAHLNEL